MPDDALAGWNVAPVCRRKGDETSVSWSPAPSLNVVSVQRGEQAWTVTGDSRQPTSCPGCGTQSKSRHSAYSRTLRDLSAQGAPVSLTYAWRAGGVETSGVIGASSPSACLVLRRRSPAGPPAWYRSAAWP